MKTIPISEAAHRIWRQWCAAKLMTSTELMDALIDHVEQQKRKEFYNSLPMPSRYVKPLVAVKVRVAKKL